MSAVACPSIPLVVGEAPATARLRIVMAQEETTTTVGAMATTILQEVQLRPWRWRGTIPTRTPIATLEGEPFPAPNPANTHLSSRLTPVRSACPLPTEGRRIASPQT